MLTKCGFSDAHRARELEEENENLRRRLADTSGTDSEIKRLRDRCQMLEQTASEVRNLKGMVLNRCVVRVTFG